MVLTSVFSRVTHYRKAAMSYRGEIPPLTKVQFCAVGAPLRQQHT